MTRRALLSAAQQEELDQALQSPPADGGLWSGPKVARRIEQQTGQKVWAQRGWDYLKRCRFPPHRPRPCHAKADKQAQANFKPVQAQKFGALM